MASSAGSRPNHYEVLGLSPSASEQEISGAFAKRMGMFGAREIAAAADIGLAFEVLRDPAKRRAYDRAIGLEPEPPSSPVTGQGMGAELMTWGSTAAAGRVTFDSLTSQVAEMEPPPQPEPPVEARLASIVASLRELSKQETRDAPDPKPERQMPADREPMTQPRIEPELEKASWIGKPAESRLDLEQLLMTSRMDREHAPADDHSPQWKRMAVAVGGLVLVAGVTGALGGMSVKDAEDQLTVPLPPAKPSATVIPAAPAPVANSGQGPVSAALSPEVRAPPRASRIVAREREAPQPAPQVGDTQSLGSTAEEAAPAAPASDPLAVETTAAQPVAANLPLPSRVIARTIDRIGYSCGAVASAAAVDGAPGTYKVTCTSGQTYQAAPVHGRYRFRRWSKL